jgi:hypothetical protein
VISYVVAVKINALQQSTCCCRLLCVKWLLTIGTQRQPFRDGWNYKETQHDEPNSLPSQHAAGRMSNRHIPHRDVKLGWTNLTKFVLSLCTGTDAFNSQIPFRFPIFPFWIFRSVVRLLKPQNRENHDLAQIGLQT